MKPLYLNCLMFFVLAVSSLPALAENDSEYGDIIRQTPEYEKITTPRDDDDGKDHHHHDPYPYPVYPPAYPPPAPGYHRSSGGGHVGPSGRFYLGVAIGDSEFDYGDIEDGDASIFRFGYRPDRSHLGYELSFYDTGEADVTSLSGIELGVRSFNLALTLNSSRDPGSRFNFFGQGGIYFADTTLRGPFDRVSEKSNGFLLAAGAEIMLNRFFGLRAEAYRWLDVEDFAEDKSIDSIHLGGQFLF